jgi:hypothetical protein
VARFRAEPQSDRDPASAAVALVAKIALILAM